MALHQEISKFLREIGGIEISGVKNGLSAGEVALWRTVVLQALIDACTPSLEVRACMRRQDAIEWLSGTSRDFMKVCDYAGLDASYVRRMAKKLMSAGRSSALSPSPMLPKKGRKVGRVRKEDAGFGVQDPGKVLAFKS